MAMAASKLLQFAAAATTTSTATISSSSFRVLCRKLSPSTAAAHSCPANPLRLLNRVLPSTICPRRPHSPFSTSLRPLSDAAFFGYKVYTTSSSAATANDDGSAESVAAGVPHPWPEWESFLQKLKSKGYFEGTPSPSSSAETATTGEDEGAEVGSGAASAMDVHSVKTACMRFARERFDLLRSLPKEDIQAVVECGCPNLFRKSVNSAKRLRAYLRLDEGDVCGACNLKGSCDRAYVIAKEDEGARTVDVVRILLSYAVDPLLLSGVGSPQIREHVEESVRKLLSELIKLSDTIPDPALPKAAVKLPPQKEQSSRVMGIGNNLSQNVEMKRGDWICSKCNFMNFARNVRCLQCKEDGPKRVNFDAIEMKKGDWTCPQCEFMNFSRNRKCFRCQGPRPRRELNPGEWECPSCDFLNYRRNKVCLKCNCDRPKDDSNEYYEDHTWKRPVGSSRKGPSSSQDDEDDFDEDEVLPLRKEDKEFVAGGRTYTKREEAA